MAHKYGSLFNIKEFKDEVDKNYKGVTLSKKDLYDIALKVYMYNVKNDKNYSDRRHLRDGLKDLSEDLFGDRFIWEKDLPQLQFKIAQEHIYKMFWCKELAKAFGENHVRDDVEAYDIAKSVLFNMLRGDYKFSDDIERQKTYFKVRSIVQHYASALEGDRDAWKKDYEAFLKDKVITIRKAARGGKYEEIQLTASEVLDMKRRDEQLEDVDEDL